MMRLCLHIVLGIVSNLVLCVVAVGAPPQYEIMDLGTLGGNFSEGRAINNAGQVTGSAADGKGNIFAYLYSGGMMQSLGALSDATISAGYAINASGQVGGFSYVGTTSDTRAILFSGGTLTNLGTLGGTGSLGYSINASGHIVGESTLQGDNAAHAYLYTGGALQDLGTLGGTSSAAYGINDSGHIVGFSDTGTGVQHAFLYSGGTMQDLGTLGGAFNSAAYAINSAGHIAGWASTSGNASHAFLYDGTMHDLGALTGRDSTGRALNDLDQIVGEAFLSDNITTHAFLYTGGTIYDLNDLIPANSGWKLTDASGINDSGWIVGTGIINGQEHGYLAKPVPEPQAVGVLAVFACVLLSRRLAVARVRVSR